MSVIDDILAKPPETRTVEFCLDREAAERLAQAQDALFQAERDLKQVDRRKDPGGEAEATARVEDEKEAVRVAAEAVRASLLRFTFRSVAATEFEALKAGHRPTEQQRTEAKKTGKSPPEWNEATFPPALVAAACIKVEGPSGEQDGLPLEEVERIWSAPNFNAAERAELGNAALSAYLMRTVVDLPKVDSATTGS